MRDLTVVDETLERAEMATAPGMAHWAGSGPENARCGKCIHFGYDYSKTNGDPGSKNASCEKFFKLTGKHGASLDKAQLGCKYFEIKPQA